MADSNYNFVSVLGYKVFSDDLSKLSFNNEKHRVVNTISPNSYGIADKDEQFKTALQSTDFLMLDGVYFALASIFLLGKNIKKNQGPDVYKHFITRLNSDNGRAFFLGSSDEVLGKIRQRLSNDYPNIKVECFSPPYKAIFSDEDNKMMIEKINAFKPNIVFIGMTAPKQEKWGIQNREAIDSNLIIAIGNVFDWYAGTQKQIHPFWFKVRLGWLVRIFQRPEIFKRNIKNQMLFFRHLLLIILRIKRVQHD